MERAYGMSKDNLVRLQKYIAGAGIASRRAAEKMIEAGKVRVNKRIAEIGDKIDPTSKDKITVDGVEIKAERKKYYIMLNKPRGFVTTMSDEKNRKCVADLVSDISARVYPIGRLDKDSEGLLLLTNDGNFANRIMHPSHNIYKTYRVTVSPVISEEQLVLLSLGITIDGIKCIPKNVSIVKEASDRTVLEFVLSQGKNREIRKMCEHVHLNVLRLRRTKVGNLKLGMLQPGKWRELTKAEIKSI